MTVPALTLCIVLGTTSLAWGYVGVGLPQLARWLAFFGLVWLLAVWQRWRWFAYIGLTVFFLAAALGLWFLNFPPGWMFGGAIFGLLAWDLTYFRYRQTFAASDAERTVVERRHLLRLSILAILGFWIASVAMALQLEFSFDWIVFLTIVLVLGVAQIARWFRTRS